MTTRKAKPVSPAQFQSQLQQAVTHHRAGRLQEAAVVYRRLMPAAPRHFDVWNLAGLVAYQQHRLDDAIKWLSKAHALNPGHAGCPMHCGLALLAAKRPEEAGPYLRRAIEIDPNYAEGWENWAYYLKTLDRLDEAIAAHHRVAALRPGYARGWYNFGLTLSFVGRSAEALACHERALAAEAKFASGHFGRGQALLELHRVDESIAAFDAGLALEPGRHEARSHRLLALHALDGISREDLLAEHIAYGRAVGRPSARTWAHSTEPERRLKVAILSPDLREHSCAYFIEPLLRHLDRDAFELYLYHDHFREDETTARLRTLASVWRNFAAQPGDTVETVIRADAPDILIDLAGHTGLTNRLPLFARRLAPVQINYLGYPNTTGVPAMDFRFTDAVADPEGESDAFATERLVRFAPTAWCYAPPTDAPAVAPLPASRRGYVTFGCFNKPTKITDATVALWSRVLQSVPSSRLRLKGAGLSSPEQRGRYAARFALHGVAAERLEFVERTLTTRQHLECYSEIDIALDTAPYNGTTTTCESLWMGVPTVALVGDRHMARVSASLLSAAGHAEWAARDESGFVACAVALAGDPSTLATIRAGLRDDLRRGPLLDASGQAERFGAALRQTWIDWCRREAETLIVFA